MIRSQLVKNGCRERMENVLGEARVWEISQEGRARCLSGTEPRLES